MSFFGQLLANRTSDFLKISRRHSADCKVQLVKAPLQLDAHVSAFLVPSFYLTKCCTLSLFNCGYYKNK